MDAHAVEMKNEPELEELSDEVGRQGIDGQQDVSKSAKSIHKIPAVILSFTLTD